MALDVLERLPPGRELAMAYSTRAQLHMLAQDTANAVGWGTRAIRLAQSLGDFETLAHALNNVGAAEAFIDYDRGHAKLEESLRLALAHGFDEHAARAINNLATLSVRNREHARAAQYLHEGITLCADRGFDAWAMNMRARRAQVHFQQGDWTRAAEAAGEVLNVVAWGHTRVVALVVLAQVRVRRGDHSAQEPLDEARDLARKTGEFQDIGPTAVARAEAAWLKGDIAGCAAEATPGYDLATTRADRWLVGELSFWMWRGGALKEAPAGCAAPFALHMAGDWRAAAAEWERLGCPYERAMALADGDEAAQLSALAILEQLGAAPAEEIVRRRLRARGVRGIPRGARPSTKRNPAGLTDREVEVLLLVAEGLQNAQIARRLVVSPRTVDNHVAAILTKLDAHTRAEAVAAAVQLGLTPTRRGQ
jgi:DNA-binding CsgD family transcriptional regulator/tetratricopeptide (TPR) repeat protein